MLSVVVPARNESANLAPLLDRLVPVLGGLDLPYEIVVVDDGSTDATFQTVMALRERERRLKLVSLSRNFGKEIALAAGLRYATGDAVVLMDADLQHPPETIRDFVAKWREGYRFVYAQRRSRHGEAPLRRFLAKRFYRVFARVGEVALLEGGGDFCLLDRKVADALAAMPERNRFGKGLYAWVGFKSAAVPFEVQSRLAGRSQWSLWRLWTYAIDGIASFTTVPLRLWTYVGAAIALLSLAFGAAILLRTLIWGAEVPGYPSLFVAVSFLAGIQLIGLGVIGEYIGRIFTEVKQRPLFLVDAAIGFDDKATDPAPPAAPTKS
jgi:glycosyltransferase involved in cell wall biosynthesis